MQDSSQHMQRIRAWHQRKSCAPALRMHVPWRRPTSPALRLAPRRWLQVRREQIAPCPEAKRQRLVILRGEVAAKRAADAEVKAQAEAEKAHVTAMTAEVRIAHAAEADPRATQEALARVAEARAAQEAKVAHAKEEAKAEEACVTEEATAARAEEATALGEAHAARRVEEARAEEEAQAAGEGRATEEATVAEELAALEAELAETTLPGEEPAASTVEPLGTGFEAVSGR